MISDSSNPSVKNAYPSFSYSIDTSSRTAVRSRRLFYALQFPSIFQPYYAPNAAAVLSSAAAFFAFGALVCPLLPE